jgi:hypothetical protein
MDRLRNDCRKCTYLFLCSYYISNVPVVSTLNTAYTVGHTIFSTLYSVCKLDEKWIKFVNVDDKLLKWMKI